MASKTSIANRALSKLGQPRIADVDTTDTKSARVISEMWDDVRDAMLQSYPWNFAIKRAVLAQTTAPSWGWDYAYMLPTDCLSPLEIKDDPDYVVENGKILTNTSDAVYLRYISRITGVSEFSPLFRQLLSCRLAFEACEELTQSDSKKQGLMIEMRYIVEQAYLSDAIEQPPDYLPEDAWLTVRA